MVDPSQPPTPAGPLPHFPSCELCRQRKVKCDRQRPCSSCTRSGATCVYPSGRGRAPKRSRRAETAQLMDRLSRLESIIKHLASENGVDRDLLPAGSMTVGHPEAAQPPASARPAQEKTMGVNGSGSGTEAPAAEATSSGRESPVPSSLDGQFGRLVIDESNSYYVSSVLWTNLANEVDGIRDLLEPEDEDDYEDTMSPKTSYLGPSSSNAALFGFRALAHSLQAYHPSLSQAVNLFAIFTENVSPQVRLFHMPTLSRMYWDAISSLESLDKNIEALLFAIYYSAVASIDDRQALSLLGMTRAAALERFRFAVEQAIARADLLNTQSMILLQAAVLFLSALRSLDESRTTWSLTTLVFHIAQTMGIHRDGTVFGLKPFETELRRRLWWYICILDSRSSESHGFQPIVHQFSSDTKFPLHVNDADLSPDMKEFPPERREPTDVTLLLLRCEALSTALKIGLSSPGMPNVLFPSRAGAAEGSASGGMSLEEQKATIQRLEERLRDNYLRDSDASNPLHSIYSMVANLMVSHFRLLVQHLAYSNNLRRLERGSVPVTNKDDSSAKAPFEPCSNVSVKGGITAEREDLFITSIEVLERTVELMSTPSIAQWAWYSKPHIQWHAVAFVLSEICSRPPSAQCDRAWETATAVYKVKGPVWRPIRRLMAKARYVREMQAKRRRGRPDGHTVSASGTASEFSSTDTPLAAAEEGWSVYGYTPAATSGMGIDAENDLGHHQGLLGAEPGDSIMDLLDLPDDLHTDEFSNFGLSEDARSFSLGMMGAGSAMDGWDGRMW